MMRQLNMLTQPLIKHRTVDLENLNSGRNRIKTNSYVKGITRFDCPNGYWEKLLELEEQYGDIDSMVYDLPIIEVDDWEKFWDIWNRESIVSSRLKNDIASSSLVKNGMTLEEYQKQGAVFKALEVIDKDPNGELIDKVWSWKFIDLSKEFPKFYQQINDLLPYRNLFNVRLWQSLRPVGIHRDGAWECNLPSEFRVSLYDENPEPVLCIEPELVPENAKFINLPKTETNTFGFNNVRCFHWSKKPGKWEKIILIPWGQPDLYKLEKLIENGIKKYPQFVNRTSNDPYADLLLR